MSLWRYPAILLILALVLSAAPVPAPAASVREVDPSDIPARYRITGPSSAAARGAVAATGAEILAAGERALDLAATPGQVRRIEALGYTASRLDTVRMAPQAGPAYHSYAEMEAAIQVIEAAHPAIVRLFSIGQSYEGRTLWAAKISDNPDQDEDEPEALFVGLYHAREHLTAEMLLSILRLLTDGYDPARLDDRITQLVNTRQIYLVFMLNPDGGEYDRVGGGYRFWRKNRQPNPCTALPGFGSGIGTDPNRNHNYNWGGAGASAEPCAETYRGTEPASAPEVTALQRFVDSRVVNGRQRINVAISFHTYGELVLWPYGYQNWAECGTLPADMFPQDQRLFQTMGAALAQATRGPPGTGSAGRSYTLMQSCKLYQTNGDFTDWAYGTHRIFAFTFEMYPCLDEGCPEFGFYPPDTAITDETARLHPAVLLLLDYADCPFRLTGLDSANCAGSSVGPRYKVVMPFVGGRI